MLLGASVRVLVRFPVCRAFPQHASSGRALRTQLRPRPRKVDCSNSASLRIQHWPTESREHWPTESREDWPKMAWACATCTFINEAGPTCGVCSDPAPGAATSIGDAKWTCETCTFVNTGETAFCEICDHGRSSLATSFRPLRASAKEDVAPVKVLEVEEEAPQVASGSTRKREAEEAEDDAPQIASGSTRKRKAKEADVIDLSDAKSEEDVVPDVKKTKQSEDEPNNLLKQLHKERMARKRDGSSAIAAGSSDLGKKEKGIISLSSLSREEKVASIEAEGTWLEKPTPELKVLSYNVWFREDLELQARLDAIGDVILQHRPDIVFLQEVTETIYGIFQQASWWKSYDCSVKPGVAAQRAYFCMQLSKLPVFSFRQSPFRNSVMGRELCLAEVDAGKGARLLVATSHLESPCPAPPTWNQMFSPERVQQAKEAMALLKEFPNVIFGGDMNWDDKKDGPPPLPSGWFDAWLQLRPGQDGFTYDTKANRMLTGNRSLQKRLDRIFCQLRDFEAVSIEMVGTEPIPDLTYSKEKKVKGQVQVMKLPVLPSDHFGLLFKLSRKA